MRNQPGTPPVPDGGLAEAMGVLCLTFTRLNPRSPVMKASSMCGISVAASTASP